LKRFEFALILIFVFLLGLAFSCNISRAVPTVVYIRTDGSIYPPIAELSSSDNITYSLTGNLSSCIVIERNDIVFDGAGYTLIGEGTGRGIELQGMRNVTIMNVEIRGFYGGILIWNFSSNNNVFGVRALDNWYAGIEVSSAMNNNITGNTVVNCQEGISLEDAEHNTVSRNFIDETVEYGIDLISASNDNLIVNNNVSNCWYLGVRLWMSSCNNTIVGNNVAHCNVGIEVSYSSNNNTIIQNSFSVNSGSGISIGYPIPESGPEWGGAANNSFIENNVINNNIGIYLIYSGNNTILHNNIQGNNASIVVVGSHVNMWDDGSKGNFWSDYNGTDADNNGVGDSPYVIDSNNIDNYPLMQVFDPPETTVPEFPSFIVLPLFFIAILFGVRVWRKRTTA
jgi:parallel beta-helix repeat protein